MIISFNDIVKDFLVGKKLVRILDYLDDGSIINEKDVDSMITSVNVQLDYDYIEVVINTANGKVFHSEWESNKLELE